MHAKLAQLLAFSASIMRAAGVARLPPVALALAQHTGLCTLPLAALALGTDRLLCRDGGMTGSARLFWQR
jgi:hypothetical protein